MSDNIQVTLSPDRVVLGPGEKAEVTAEVRNLGNIVEVFFIEVQGIEASWYTISVSSVSLFPGDKQTVHISLTPPLASASKAGSYALAVKVSSKRDPTVMTTANLALDVGIVSSYELGLSPQRIRARKGSYKVLITNTGNVTNTFKLEASDPEEMCTYGFKSDTVAVEAGATAKVDLAVNPKKKPFTGATRMFSFTVKAIPIASEIKTVEGQLECPPLLPRWAIMAITAGLVVIVAAIVVLFMTGGKGVAAIDEDFQLGPERFQMYEVQLTAGTIKAEAQWSGADRLSLTLYKPGGEAAAIARQEGATPLNITYSITSQDIAKGDSWRIYIANLTDNSEANGTIKVYQP